MAYLLLALLGAGQIASAMPIVLEPDDFASGTILNHILPEVSLITADSNNDPYPFDVTSATDLLYAPTGDQVFAHAGVNFWNNDRRLRMTFAQSVFDIEIDFAGGNSIGTEVGILEAYAADGTLLTSYTTAPRSGGSVETMTVSRPLGDIAYAVAYVPQDLGNFGRLDHLSFTPVPEPATYVLAGLGALAFLFLPGRKR